MKKKIVLIKKKELSDWRSCQLITSNLEKAYLKAYSDFQVETKYVSADLNSFLAFELATEIKKLEIDEIVWLEHRPCAANILTALDLVYKNETKKPNLIVHLFGDFVLDCNLWEQVEEIMKTWPIKFIVSSHKQKLLVDSLINFNNGNAVEVIPFPVDETLFNLDNLKNNRSEVRSKFSITDEDIVLIYTGRISYQKNIEMLIKLFNSISPMFNNKLHLWIAGPWDNIFLPYAGRLGAPGSYFSQLNGSLNLNELKNVKFIGEFNSNELKKVYHAADCFISLSTFNDEDFGMSPAEAIMTGLPCLLSHWGGYSSFAKYSSNVDLIPVSFEGKRPEVYSDEAKKIITQRIFKLKSDLKLREIMINDSKKYLEINAVVDLLNNKKLDQEIALGISFTPKFFKLCALSKLNPGAPFRDKHLELSTFYKDVYELYGN